VHLSPRTLPGRIALAFVLLIVATWLALGVSLFVVLRGLHESETTARLTDVAVPLVARLRASIAAGQGTAAILSDLADQTTGTDMGIYLQLADGRIVGVEGGAGSLAGLSLDPALVRGDVAQGTYRAQDGTSWAWAASILRAANVRGPRALIVATPDRSAAGALRDLLAALPLVLLATLAVGVPIAVWLSRSVTGPLRRLTVAVDAVAAAPGGAAEQAPLALEGPAEVQDLTTRFEGMRRELRAGRRQEAELLADLRHDLRTPLTVIEGFAEALVDGTARGDAADRAARAIVEEAHRIDALVEGLGDLERLRGGAGLRPETLAATELVTEASARFAAGASAVGVDLEADPGPPGLVVTADRLAVQRILANLVSNAMTAIAGQRAGTGTATHHIRVEARPVTDHATGRAAVALSVSDDGPGFPPGAAARAFDRFYRGDPARSGPGSGLGLAIVRELAEAHGGRAYAEDLAPRGARVGVILPASPSILPSAQPGTPWAPPERRSDRGTPQDGEASEDPATT
jgi:two-component system OmpR family sensor kinase